MRCLRQLAIKGDARVPSACAEAIKAAVTVHPRRNLAARANQLARMLNEGGSCVAGNSCPNDFQSVGNNRCNDVLSQCLLPLPTPSAPSARSARPHRESHTESHGVGSHVLCFGFVGMVRWCLLCCCRVHRWLRQLCARHIHRPHHQEPLQSCKLAHRQPEQHRLRQHMLQGC